MPEATAPEPIDRRFRHGLRAHRAGISEAVLVLGLLLTVLALGYFTPLSTLGFFQSINAVTYPPSGTNYNLLFVILGPIVVIVGAYLVGAYFHARGKFEHLMLTKSKAEFLRNIPQLEDLLWDLTPADEDRYQQRLSEMRLKR